jgi:hypothetical protein
MVAHVIARPMEVKLIHVRKVDIIFPQLILKRLVQQLNEQTLPVWVRSHRPLEGEI